MWLEAACHSQSGFMLGKSATEKSHKLQVDFMLKPGNAITKENSFRSISLLPSIAKLLKMLMGSKTAQCSYSFGKSTPPNQTCWRVTVDPSQSFNTITFKDDRPTSTSFSGKIARLLSRRMYNSFHWNYIPKLSSQRLPPNSQGLPERTAPRAISWEAIYTVLCKRKKSIWPSTSP